MPGLGGFPGFRTWVNSILAMLALLYNAALEERILAFRMSGKSISLYDQYKSLTTIR